MKLAGLLAAVLALAGCGPKDQAEIAGAAPPGPPASERAYHAPPSLIAVTALAAGRVGLTGKAIAGAQVRVAAPAGATAHARADARGSWRLTLPAAAGLRLFGVSMLDGDRAVQAEGYLAVTPDGLGALLRAGSGARVLRPGPPTLCLLAVDFDSQGVAVVSGAAPPGEVVRVGVDGVARGSVVADPAGRFSLAIDEPLGAGVHDLEIAGPGHGIQTAVPITEAPPFAGPYQVARTAIGWRIDWMTPGGGRQTTLLLTPQRNAA